MYRLQYITAVVLAILVGSLAQQPTTTSTFAPTGTVPPVTYSQCAENARMIYRSDPNYSPNYHCEDPGYNTEPGWIDRFVGRTEFPSYQPCFDGCKANPNCISFAWNSTNNYCRLFGKTINAKGFVSDKKSATFYWNLLGCFQCLQSNKPNLVSNPGFELALGAPPFTNLTYPGWTASNQSESNYQATPGPYGNATGVTGMSIPDSTRPLKRNNVLVLTGDGFSHEPIIDSTLLTGLNTSGYYLIKYSMFIKYFVVLGDMFDERCTLNTGLYHADSAENSYEYQMIGPDYQDNSIWHQGRAIVQPRTSRGQVRIIWRCGSKAVLYVDNVSIQEFPINILI